MATPKNQSVMKAFTLLQSFRGPDEWLTSSELSRRAKLPEASGYRLVQTLEGIGAVVRDSRGRYRPGMLLLALSQNIVARELWREVPQSVLCGIAKTLGGTVHVGVLEDDMVTYVARAGRYIPGLAIGIGAQFEPYCTALGKVLLAALPEQALNAFLWDGELIPLTERTITDRAALRETLVQVRQRGYATDDRETLDTLRCLAAPIRNPVGKVVAAISLSDSPERLGDERQHEVREALLDAARLIARRLYPWRDDEEQAGAGPTEPLRVALEA